MQATVLYLIGSFYPFISLSLSLFLSLSLSLSLSQCNHVKICMYVHVGVFLTSKIFFVTSTCSLLSISRSFSSSKRSPYTLWVSCNQHRSNSMGAFIVSPEQNSKPYKEKEIRLVCSLMTFKYFADAQDKTIF